MPVCSGAAGLEDWLEQLDDGDSCAWDDVDGGGDGDVEDDWDDVDAMWQPAGAEMSGGKGPKSSHKCSGSSGSGSNSHITKDMVVKVCKRRS